jgi:hypothetical protein
MAGAAELAVAAGGHVEPVAEARAGAAVGAAAVAADDRGAAVRLHRRRTGRRGDGHRLLGRRGAGHDEDAEGGEKRMERP